MPFNLGLPEIILLMGLALIIFGPKRLPELGQSLGEAIVNFKKAFQKKSDSPEIEQDINREEH